MEIHKKAEEVAEWGESRWWEGKNILGKEGCYSARTVKVGDACGPRPTVVQRNGRGYVKTSLNVKCIDKKVFTFENSKW